VVNVIFKAKKLQVFRRIMIKTKTKIIEIQKCAIDCILFLNLIAKNEIISIFVSYINDYE